MTSDECYERLVGATTNGKRAYWKRRYEEAVVREQRAAVTRAKVRVPVKLWAKKGHRKNGKG